MNTFKYVALLALAVACFNAQATGNRTESQLQHITAKQSCIDVDGWKNLFQKHPMPMTTIFLGFFAVGFFGSELYHDYKRFMHLAVDHA